LQLFIKQLRINPHQLFSQIILVLLFGLHTERNFEIPRPVIQLLDNLFIEQCTDILFYSSIVTFMYSHHPADVLLVTVNARLHKEDWTAALARQRIDVVEASGLTEFQSV
jgi:hypothetical protein